MEDSNQSYEDYFRSDNKIDIEEFKELRFSDSSHSLFQNLSKSLQDSKKQLTTRSYKKHLYQDESTVNVIEACGNIQLGIEQDTHQLTKVQFSQETIFKNNLTRCGNPKETTWLNANLKTQTINQLMRGVKIKIYNAQQKQAIGKFISSGCSFQDTLTLLKSSEKIRLNCLELFKSTQLVQKILCSRSMQFSNKMIFIKYLRKIQHNTQFPSNFRKWKEDHGVQQMSGKTTKQIEKDN